MTQPTFETLLYDVTDHVATVSINRPERRNALNRTAYAELEQVFRHIQQDPEVRAVVLTGAGGTFCAGEDVKEMMTGDADAGAATAARLSQVRPRPTPAAVAVLECDRPIVAAVAGPAVGWGMDLSLFADIRLAGTSARFGELFVKRGLVTDIGGMQRLPRIVGPQRAAQLLFSGEIIDAATALDIGLVLEVVDDEALVGRATAMAAGFAANPPLAVRYLKEGLRREYWGDHEPVGSWVSQTLGVLFRTEDHREGVAAFLEKREPRYQGR